MWGYHTGMGWWMVFGGIWMVVFWAAVIALVVWGVRSLIQPKRQEAPEDPLAIAQRRYAKGEITREQLDEIRSVLRR